MTEEEAKKRWCPFVRVAYAPGAVNGCNRPFDSSQQTCIGSACMAWRGDQTATRDTGYCGLAGEP